MGNRIVWRISHSYVSDSTLEVLNKPIYYDYMWERNNSDRPPVSSSPKPNSHNCIYRSMHLHNITPTPLQQHDCCWAVRGHFAGSVESPAHPSCALQGMVWMLGAGRTFCVRHLASAVAGGNTCWSDSASWHADCTQSSRCETISFVDTINSSSIPDILVGPLKSCAGCCNPSSDFVINMQSLREGTAGIGDLVHDVGSLSIDSDHVLTVGCANDFVGAQLQSFWLSPKCLQIDPR